MEEHDLVFHSQVSRGTNNNIERKSQIIMNLLVKGFFILLFIIFLFVALGQWNHPNFQQKAYEQAKELIAADLMEKEGKSRKLY